MNSFRNRRGIEFAIANWPGGITVGSKRATEHRTGILIYFAAVAAQMM